MSATKDQLVSTALIQRRITELEEQIAEQRKMRPENDPFFTSTAWLIAEFRATLRDAALEYRPTSDVAVLTGWSSQTLRSKARDVMAGKDPGEEWKDLLVKQVGGGDYTFAIATVPVKSTGALPIAS